MIVDFGRPYAIPVSISGSLSGGTSKISLPQFLDLREREGWLDGQFPPLAGIAQLYVPFASSLTLRRDKQPDVDLRIVLRTTSKAARETANPIELALLRQWRVNRTLREHAVAAAATGTLRSAFDPNVRAAKPARVFVLASSQFFENPLARAAKRPDIASGIESKERSVVEQLAVPYASRNTEMLRFTSGLLAWMAHGEEPGDCSRRGDVE